MSQSFLQNGKALSLTAFSIIVGLSTATASATNLVNNGDFANVGNKFVVNTVQGGDDILTPTGTSIPGWTNVANFVNELWIEPNNSYNLTASPGNSSGYFVDLTGQENEKPYGGIEQKITTVAGMGYTLTFALGASTLYNSGGFGPAALTASAKGSSTLASHLFSLSPTTTNDWVTETLTFVADSDSTTIEFLADSNNTSQNVGLDNVVMQTRLLGTATTLTASPTTAISGASVSLTALVKPTEGTLTPTGKVQFKSSTTVLGTATLNGTGQATFATTALTVGEDSLTAVYSGDSIHGMSTSKTDAVTITAGGSAITLSTRSLAFGNQASGTTSASKSVTITNSGTATVSFSSIAVSGGQADDFGLSKTCGSTLAAKAICTVSVTFKPVSTGAKTASISIADNASGSPQTVALTGTGISGGSAPTLGLSATSIAFGDQALDATSSAKSVTLTNSSSATVTFSSIALSGGQADDFELTKTCGSTLTAKATCSVSVTFKPVSTGAKSTNIRITDNASGSPQTIAVSGTGTAARSSPTLHLSQTSLAFGDEKVGGTSSAKTVTLTNSGSGTLSITSIELTGGQADDYAMTKTCGSSLAANAHCTVSVTFKPVSTGVKSASISIADNASGSPQTVALSGTGG